MLAPVFCTSKKLAEVSRQIIVANAQEIAWALSSLSHADKSIKRPVFLLIVVCFMNRTQFWIIVNGYAFLFRSSFRMGVTGLKYCA